MDGVEIVVVGILATALCFFAGYLTGKGWLSSPPKQPSGRKEDK